MEMTKCESSCVVSLQWRCSVAPQLHKPPSPPRSAANPLTASAGRRYSNIQTTALRVQGGDASAIPGLVDSVIQSNYIVYSFIGSSGAMHDGLVNAEIEWNRGRRRGVEENNVVKIVNRLADALGAPQYAHTTLPEVRRLRVQTLLLHASFANLQPMYRRQDSAKDFSPTLSPVQALHLVGLMIIQKLENPEFQETTQEHNAKVFVRSSAHYQPDFSDHSRSREMQKVMLNASAKLSMRDMLAVSQDSMALLGMSGGVK